MSTNTYTELAIFATRNMARAGFATAAPLLAISHLGLAAQEMSKGNEGLVVANIGAALVQAFCGTVFARNIGGQRAK